MFSAALLTQAEEILAMARAKGLRIATAESCTGGLIAGLLTEIAGSSDVFERGFVTYSNEAKHDLLAVPLELIEEHGAVSSQVATAMTQGALKNSRANYAIAVTGIAGPGGGSASKPVGLVYVAITGSAVPDTPAEFCAVSGSEFRFGDIGRDGVRLATVEAAMKLLRAAI